MVVFGVRYTTHLAIPIRKLRTQCGIAATKKYLTQSHKATKTQRDTKDFLVFCDRKLGNKVLTASPTIDIFVMPDSIRHPETDWIPASAGMTV